MFWNYELKQVSDGPLEKWWGGGDGGEKTIKS